PPLSIRASGFVGGNRGSTLRSVGEAGKLLEAGLDRAAGALAPVDHQHRVVTRDRPDDLLPARPVDRETQRLRSARRRLDHEQRPHPVHRDEHRGEELLQVGADADGSGRYAGLKGNSAKSACFPTWSDPISFSSPNARAASSVSTRRAASPFRPAARASARRSTSPTLTAESVPRPTRSPAARMAGKGAAPWP